MKYIITENRLNDVIFKYLDMRLEGIEPRKGQYVDIVFAKPGEEYGMLGWEKPGNLYVYYELLDDLESLFGLQRSDALEVTGRYVADRYNLKVNHTNIDITFSSFKVADRYNLKVNHTSDSGFS